MKAIVKIKSFFHQSIRVLKVTDRPTKEDYKAIVKVTGIGILVIGLIGFIISTIANYLVG